MIRLGWNIVHSSLVDGIYPVMALAMTGGKVMLYSPFAANKSDEESKG